MTRSWYALERYALGECQPDEAREIEESLAHDPDTSAILDAIRSDHRSLPPLSIPTPQRARNRVWSMGIVLLAAAALLVTVSRDTEPAVEGWKGGDVALEVVRLRDGVQTVTPASVAPGDHLGLRLTCPEGSVDVDIVVFHGDEVAFPLQPATIDCGNHVPLPGAFSVDSPGELVVCATFDGVPTRAQLAADRRASPLCIDLLVR